MRRLLRRWLLLVLPAAMCVAGCAGTDNLQYFFGDDELSYAKDVAQTVDYPDVDAVHESNALATPPPRTVADRTKGKVHAMTLKEAIHLALANNRIIRTDGQFLGRGNGLYTNSNTPSIYDPAIQGTGVLFSGRGVEAALAEFDTTFSTSMLWGRSEDIQNNIFFGQGTTPGSTLQQDTGVFRSALRKRFADGASIVLGHDWNYRGALLPGQLFNSTYTGNLRAEYRRPLWAGSGAEFTRTAGPTNPNFGAITGVSQGVLIARINNDITIAGFESAVRNLVKDVEDVYWDLYLQYRLYHALVVSRERTREVWQRFDADKRDKTGKIDPDGGVFKPHFEPQTRTTYYSSKAAAEAALNDIYTTEIRLRRLIGLPVRDNDGILRPVDDPMKGKLITDWRSNLTEALTRRVELRRQKWNIKSLELQFKAAQSLTNPRLDFVSGYQVNGFGDRLFGNQDNDGSTTQGLSSAYETLTQGNQTTYNLGFELSIPIGFRSARSQVRNLELRLRKSRELLATQELEISHELAIAIQNLEARYAGVKWNYDQLSAAREWLGRYSGRRELGNSEAFLNTLLGAIQAVGQAEQEYFRSLINYNKALTEIQYRKGTLLEYNNVFIAENEWTPAAYRQALRRAWARTRAFDNHKLLHTEASEFVNPDGSCKDCGNDQQPQQVPPGPAESDRIVPPRPEPAKSDAGVASIPAATP